MIAKNPVPTSCLDSILLIFIIDSHDNGLERTQIIEHMFPFLPPRKYHITFFLWAYHITNMISVVKLERDNASFLDIINDFKCPYQIQRFSPRLNSYTRLATECFQILQ